MNPTTPDEISEELSVDAKNKRIAKKFIGVIIGMFLFGFASIPLYRIYCAAVDPGGSSAQNGEVELYGDTKVDKSHTIRIRFATQVNKQLPWHFEVSELNDEVYSGEKGMISFRAKNLSDVPIKGKAVYDINPPQAGQYFKKIECFCFTEQVLGPKEEMNMALRYWFDPDMPKDINDITIAYTFFNIDSSFERSQKNAELQ